MKTLIEQIADENFENQAGQLNNFVPWQQLGQEYNDLLNMARHTHINIGTPGDDRCKKCGHDLRHIVHQTKP